MHDRLVKSARALTRRWQARFSRQGVLLARPGLPELRARPLFGLLDTPVPGQQTARQVYVAGWVLHAGSQEPELVFALNGRPLAAHCGRAVRPDVQSVYPALAPHNPYPGVSAIVDLGPVAPGSYILTCRARLAGVERLLARVPIQVGSHELPYAGQLAAAGTAGRVLGREQIYCSGPPVPTASPDVLALLLRHAAPPLLDVGCGLGAYVAALAQHGLAGRGLEIKPEYVAAAQALGRPVELYDGGAIPYADGAFDTVIAVEVLEHVPHWESLLAEMLRVARRCVWLSVPNCGVIPALAPHLVVPWHMLEATHVNFFTAEILAHRLGSLPNAQTQVFTYSPFAVNGKTFDYRLCAVIHKQAAQ